jgi:hypothetical protein
MAVARKKVDVSKLGIDHNTLYTLITPEIAEQLLERNTRNRPLKPGVVERYARDMAAGKWEKNAFPITIDWNDAIHNGQHRLWAIIESGVAQEMILLTNLDPATIMTVDNGAVRSYADFLQIRSRSETGEPYSYANETQAVLRWIHWYEKMWPALSRSQQHGKAVATFAELDELSARYPEAVEAVQWVTSNAKTQRLARRASFGFVLTMAIRHNRPLAERFVEVMKTGMPSYEDDPAFTLRERLTAARITGERLDLMTELVFLIKAWNQFAVQKPLRSVRWSQNEVMPAIIGTPQAGEATSRGRLAARTKMAITEKQESGDTKSSLGRQRSPRGRRPGVRARRSD